MKPQIRRIVIQIEEIHNEMGKTIDPPARKATVAAIIKNPFSGKYVENLEPLYDLGAEIGGMLAKKAVKAMDVQPSAIVSYGKGAIVGAGAVVTKNVKSFDVVVGKPAKSIKKNK